MSKTKWYTKAIYLGVALAMTLGLLMVPAAGADPDFASTCGSLEAGIGYGAVGVDMGTAEWTKTVEATTPHSGTYSAKLDTGSTALGLAAAKVPYGGTLTALAAVGVANMKFWTYYVTAGRTSFAALWLDTDDDDVADVLLVNNRWDTEGNTQVGLEPGKWLEVHPHEEPNSGWSALNYDAATGEITDIGANTKLVGGPYGNLPYQTLAAWALIKYVAAYDPEEGTFGGATVLCVGQMIGGAAQGVAYADEIIIDSVTYGMEPCYELVPDIAKDVKGSQQTFTVYDACGPATVGTFENWTITEKLNLSSGDVAKMAGGDSENYITIRSLKPGDCVIEVDITVGDYEEGLSAEKKWGLIHHTILDLDTDTIGAQTDVSDEAGTAGAGNATTENVTDTVYSTFFKEPYPATFIDEAGHAVVHWWLIVDDAAGENETAIDAIMAALGECPEEGTEPCGCGTYADWPVDETATDWQAEDNPFDAIGTVYAGNAAANTTFSAVIEGIVAADNDPNLDGTFNVPLGISYIKTMTEDDVGDQTRGLTGVTLSNTGAEDILIVTLVEYPWNYFGENPVCIEKGTKTWYPPGVPPIPEQIKVPQVRWAGEKIVLEKEWGVEGKIVVFALQGNSVGSLEAIYTDDIAASDAETVITTVQEDGVARCILQSQPQGQADVKAALYTSTRGTGGSFSEVMGTLNTVTPPQNHDFLVYFLALEDVAVDTDLSELEEIDAGDSANVTVKVRGWFTRDDLESDRPRGDADGDGLYELPAGRIVLPDDWAALAGSDLATSDKASRPQYDLMNTPGAGVTNTTGGELGPYDSGVRTTTIPGKAEAPCIGPFNALQPWSNFDAVTLDPINRWIATASVVADSTVAGGLRNTVVPDATIDWYDCPMPQALVTFNVTDTGVLVLAALDKGTVLDYGIDADGNFTAPFYAVEIPSHWLIPVAGYFWDSWGGTDGPYDYWDDVDVTPNDDNILEVYSDNHGYAGVTIVGTGLANECVTLDVIADFPVMAAKYVAVDTWTDVCWGIAVAHLNADFEVSDRTGKATPDVPLTISFYGLKAAGTGVPWTTGGTDPYVKAEWDFDGDSVIDVTVENTTSAATLVTQTFNFTAAGNYSPWLRVTDTNGLVDVCEKPNYIVLGGEPSAEFPLCDINESGTVDIADFVLFAASYGLSLGDVDYDERCDLNESNGVDILDFIIFAQCYVAEA